MDQPIANLANSPAAPPAEQPAAPTRNRPSLELLKDAVHVTSTLLLGISTFCFVIGLLIVNLRLAAYGVHSLEIDRAEYVLVGAVAVFLCTASYFALGIVVRHLKAAFGNLKAKEYKKGVRAFFSALGTLLTAQLLLSRLSDNAAYLTDWRVWASILAMGGIASTVYSVAKRIYVMWMQVKSASQCEFKSAMSARISSFSNDCVKHSEHCAVSLKVSSVMPTRSAIDGALEGIS
jgi:hypothetical protein